MIKAIIIEDNKLQMAMLSDLVADFFPFIDIVGRAEMAGKGVKLINKHKPDLIFLDIDLPDKTGFEMLNDLEDHFFDIIFTTAHEKYALLAHSFDAVSFLVKPITRESLEGALTRLKLKRKNQYGAQQMQETLKKIIDAYGNHQKIAVPSLKEINYVNVEDILRMEADGNYTTIYFKKGKPMVASKQVGEFEKQLSGNKFFRIHDKHLINMRCVKSFFKGNTGTVIMEDGTQLPVSRRRKDEFLKALDFSAT